MLIFVRFDKTDADTVNSLYFVIETNHDDDVVTLVNDKEKWAGYFTSLYDNNN